MTVALSARSRGEVLIRSGQRFLGALAATVVASPLAQVLAPYPLVVVGILLVVFALGWYLREVSRVWWAAAITSVLALASTLWGEAGDPWPLLGSRLAAICVDGSYRSCALLADSEKSLLTDS
jgi:Fusaric acid resistance protein-like